MGKKGGTTSETKLPEWYENAAKDQIALGNSVSKTGYVPYQGADVAAFTPQQVAGMQSSSDWMSTMNGTPRQNVAASLPPSQNFNGVQGYSSYGGYMDEMGKLEKAYPGLYDYINSFTIDKETGKMPSSSTTGGGSGGGGGGSTSGSQFTGWRNGTYYVNGKPYKIGGGSGAGGGFSGGK